MEMLEQLIKFIPILRGLFVGDVGISVTDREKFLYYKPGRSLDLKVPIGAPLNEGMIASQAIMHKRRLVKRMDATLWGVPFVAVAVPIIDENGEAIGAITIQETVERQDELRDMAKVLNDSIDILASTTEEISAQAEEIAAVCHNLSSLVAESTSRMKETDQVVGFIRELAGQTNLLGINAAIEAARVGEQGRGFGVVAVEIRKLATSSSDSVKEIGQIMRAIQSDSRVIENQIIQMEDVIADVASATTHVAIAVQHAADQAHRLDRMADELIDGNSER